MREELLATDNPAAPRFVAIIGFQTLIHEPSVDSQKAIQPLINYLSKCGEVDPHRWQLEMIIAQYLASQGHAFQAGEWAKDAHRHAPSAAQPDIHQFSDSLISMLEKNLKKDILH